jgi:[protein-PII] uridylyltransferase
LGTLARGEVATTHPLASRLAAELTRPLVIFLATLLHDVGKDIGGKHHAERGAVLARTILARLHVPEEEIEDVCRLIREHLTMYMVAMRRDLSDPEAIEEFARVVGSREGLRELYLLTVADLSTTSAVSMTAWKANMLSALFKTTDAFLSGRGDGTSRRAARVREQARALWTDDGARAAFEEYLASMPDRYFLSNAADQIAAHGQLAVAPGGAGVSCSLLPSEQEGVMGLCVVTRGTPDMGLYVVAGDRPGLLASIAAAITANGLAIRSAQINSRATPEGAQQAIDMFWVRADGGEDRHQDKLASLQRDLNAMLEGQTTAARLIAPRQRPSYSRRPAPPVATEVLFDHHGSSDHTIIEVIAEDQLGLLFKLAGALHALDLTIGFAKVSTEGKRVIDVFYVTEADGQKLQPGPRAEAVRAALHRCLDDVTPAPADAREGESALADSTVAAE